MRAATATLEGTAIFAGAVALSLVAALALVEVSPAAGILVAALPLLAVGAVWVVTSGQVVLFAAAIALPITTLAVVAQQFAGALYPQDVIAALALAAWIFARFLGAGRVQSIPRTPVLGWPLIIFGAVILSATLRGHYAYGASLIGQPLRLFLYAAIVAGLIGITPARMYQLLQWLFYPGVFVAALAAAFYLATGGSSTDQSALSTGGTRLLGISTSLYCAGALFLALLNVRLVANARERALHLVVAAVAAFCVAAGFGRAAYVGVAFVCVVFFATSTRLRNAVLHMLPLALPFVALGAIAVSQVAPTFVSSIGRRVLSSPESDANVRWRVEANRAVLAQVREQPLVGVGFGRTTEIFVTVDDPSTGIPTAVPVGIGQDPHNGYVFLLAGGGILALATFLVVVVTFVVDARRRYRGTEDPIERLLVVWACSMLFVFLLNAASGTAFANPENLLTIWALLVLPAIVPLPAASPVAERSRRAGRPSLSLAGSTPGTQQA